MLNNEDIRLFVDVINEDDDAKDQYRRITSINIARSGSRVNSKSKERIKYAQTPSNLSLSVNALKFKNKKIRLKPRVKHSNSKSIHESPINLLPYSGGSEKMRSRIKKNLLRPLTKHENY